MKLYFLCASDDGDLDQCDLHVVAKDPDTAMLMWMDYYGMTEVEPRDYLVFQLPVKVFGPERVIGWHDKVKLVTTRHKAIGEAEEALGLNGVQP